MRKVIGLIVGAFATLAACGTPTANQGTVSNASGPAPASATSPAADAPTWGKRYTWGDGLAVEVATPAACKPSAAAYPQNVQRAVKFKVTIVNGTSKPFEAAALSFGTDAQFNGAKAEAVTDVDGPCGGGGMESATVMPGKTYTFEAAFSVSKQPGEMQLAFQPSFGADKAVFTGQA